MASEYYKWKYKDVPHDEAPTPLKGKAKLLNWLHYHWLLLVVIIVIASILISVLWNLSGIGQVKPDHRVALVLQRKLSDSELLALSTALSAFSTDVNGDGTVKVEVRQYPSNPSDDPETSAYYKTASDTQLVADITKGESFLFVTDEPYRVQAGYQIYAFLDGTVPEEGDNSIEQKVLSWTDCPALSQIPVGETDTSALYIGRRVFYEEEKENAAEADKAFWQELIKGALQ